MNNIDWLPVVGAWSVTVDGVKLRDSEPVPMDGRAIHVVVQTLCGAEDTRIECASMQPCTAAQFARRAQIVASIHHPSQRACWGCVDAFRFKLSPSERRFAYTTAPHLGPIVGIGMNGF